MVFCIMVFGVCTEVVSYHTFLLVFPSFVKTEVVDLSECRPPSNVKMWPGERHHLTWVSFPHLTVICNLYHDQSFDKIYSFMNDLWINFCTALLFVIHGAHHMSFEVWIMRVPSVLLFSLFLYQTDICLCNEFFSWCWQPAPWWHW
mgnify:CR=1 FL=1